MSENEKGKVERTPVEMLKDAFAGMKGRQPTSDQELNEWLASSEGIEATMLETTLASRRGEIGRS